MSYVQGALIPVPAGNKQKYKDMCTRMASLFQEYGATQVVENWGVDIPDGQTTDMKRAVEAPGDETVVLSWVICPHRKRCDAATEKMRNDQRMQSGDFPFDGRRMIFGGFEPMLDTKKG